MAIAILGAVILVVACLVALSGFFFVKKSSDTLQGLGWIVIGIIALTCWHALVAAAINLLSIPVGSWSMSVADVLLGGALWAVVWRTKDVQRYEYRIADLVVTGGLVAFAGLFLALHNGGLKLAVNFATIDPAPRIIEAIDVVNTHTLYAMYYHSLTNGLLMEILGPLTTPDYYYRIFVFSGALFLVFVGLLFYALIRKYLRSRLLAAVGMVVVALFILAYPLNATLYGFVYIGMGIAIVGYLAFVADAYLRDEVSQWPSVALLMLGCLGLITCYAMFVPVMFVSVIIVIFLKQAARGRLISLETLLVCVAVFVVPIAVGMIYTYGGVFTAGVSMGDAISSEGAGYRDLFSNFLPFVPLAAFGFGKMIRQKNLATLSVMLPVSGLFTLGLFCLGMLGKVSSYYFFKSYNVLWFVVMYLVMAGIAAISTRETAILVSVFAVIFGLVFGFAMSGADYKLKQSHPLFNPTDNADLLFDIYTLNKVWTRAPGGLDPDQQELYHYVYHNYTANGVSPVPIISYWQDAFWYQAISGQHNRSWNEAGLGDPATAMDILNNTEAQYVLVLVGDASVTYQRNQSFFDSLQRVYENEAGFVAKLHP